MPKKETSEKKTITLKLFKKIIFFKKVIMLNIKWDEKKDSILKSEKVLFSSPKYVNRLRKYETAMIVDINCC